MDEFVNEKVLQLSHDNIKTLFDAQFCQNNKCPMGSEIITLIEQLRRNREYFSYAMPFNLTEDALLETMAWYYDTKSDLAESQGDGLNRVDILRKWMKLWDRQLI